jgi:hypothetical protein
MFKLYIDVFYLLCVSRLGLASLVGSTQAQDIATPIDITNASCLD